MEDTIKLLRKLKPGCKVMVGGAVLNQEYADMIGADILRKRRNAVCVLCAASLEKEKNRETEEK